MGIKTQLIYGILSKVIPIHIFRCSKCQLIQQTKNDQDSRHQTTHTTHLNNIFILGLSYYSTSSFSSWRLSWCLDGAPWRPHWTFFCHISTTNVNCINLLYKDQKRQEAIGLTLVFLSFVLRIYNQHKYIAFVFLNAHLAPCGPSERERYQSKIVFWLYTIYSG